MQVPATAPAGWRGWHQDIPIRAGHAYLLAAEMKCQDIPTGEVRVHAHFLQTDGALCRQNAMTSIGPSLHGTTDWTLVSGTLTAPADAALLQIHLTMDQSGTVWHDAVVAAEVTPPSSVRYAAPSRHREERAGLAGAGHHQGISGHGRTPRQLSRQDRGRAQRARAAPARHFQQQRPEERSPRGRSPGRARWGQAQRPATRCRALRARRPCHGLLPVEEPRVVPETSRRDQGSRTAGRASGPTRSCLATTLTLLPAARNLSGSP